MDNEKLENLQAEFDLLRSEDLFQIARNSAAVGRKLAIQNLVRRCSPLATHPDIAAESSSEVLSDPRILKITDPASIYVVNKSLPGIMDVLYHDISARKDLERVVSENHIRTLALVADHETAQTKRLSESVKALSAQLESQHNATNDAVAAATSDFDANLPPRNHRPTTNWQSPRIAWLY